MKTRVAIILIVILASCLVTVDSCKKPEKVEPSGSGKGGSATIAVTPVHHGEYVDTCTVYIKYNTSDAPIDGVYDDSVVCALVDTIPVAVFTGLKKGDYYLFARGFHAVYVPPYVKGGVPCKISTESRINVFLPTYSY